MDPTLILQALLTGLILGGIYVVLSLGLDVIVGVLDVPNFAHGAFLMIGMFLSYFLYTLYNIPLFAILAILPGVYAVLSIPIYFGLFRPVLNKSMSTKLFYFASLSLVIENIALVSWGSAPVQLRNPYRMQSLSFGPVQLNEALLISFLLSVIATILVFAFLYKTERGTIIRAIIMNKPLISLVGIDIQKFYLQGICLAMALTGLGGFLLSIYYPVSPTAGETYNIFMWIAVVLGGSGTIVGALIGGLIVGVTVVVTPLFVPLVMQNVVLFILFIAMVVLRPRGLLGGRA